MKNKAQVIKAIILAGGYSRRMNLKVPKQLVKINKKPLLAYTLDRFERCNAIAGITLVAHRKYILQCRNLIKKYSYKKIEQLVIGGRTRQKSVFNALRKIRDCDYVLIHDGVRPFVTQKIISRIIKAVKNFGAVTYAVKATDTIVEAEKGFIDHFLCRNRLWHIQTPQAFKFDLIFQAQREAKLKRILNSTDDARLVLKLKKNKIRIIKGSRKNIKITRPFDLYLAKLLLQK